MAALLHLEVEAACDIMRRRDKRCPLMLLCSEFALVVDCPCAVPVQQ